MKGALSEAARRRKERTYPELSGDQGRAKLNVLAGEIGIRLLPRTRAKMWKMCLDSTYSDMETLRQVSLCRQASDLDMNWTASFLVQSDKLVIVLHLLLALVHTLHQVSLILQDSEKTLIIKLSRSEC